ncbi:hypothetical protein D9M68_902980 [compost metagenome]
MSGQIIGFARQPVLKAKPVPRAGATGPKKVEAHRAAGPAWRLRKTDALAGKPTFCYPFLPGAVRRQQAARARPRWWLRASRLAHGVLRHDEGTLSLRAVPSLTLAVFLVAARKFKRNLR